MNVFRHISNCLAGIGRVFRNEFRLMTGDVGLLLFFLFLPLAYPVVYTLIYNTEVVRDIPIAVVDDSRTADSRTLVRMMSASPAIQIYAYCPNMADAKKLMAEGKVFGIMQIPHDYAKDIGRGTVANASFFAEVSLLLRYRALLSALTDLQIDLVSEITGEKIASAGLGSLATSSSPIKSESNFLGDSEQGFASFVMPGIVILILQQSMLLGICLLGGTSRERRRRNGGADPEQTQGVPASVTAWGKALAYTVFYIPCTIYIVRCIPEMFDLPHFGNPIDYMLFLFPLLLSTSFLGQTLNLFMKERESCFVLIVFTSIMFLFLSGLTWPRYAISSLWTWVGNAIPAVWGVEGFIRINSNAATLAEVHGEYIALWILTGIYMLAAIWVTSYINRLYNEKQTNKL